MADDRNWREQLLEDQRFISQLIATRKEPEPWWRSSTLISGAVAVLTVSLSGAFAVQTQHTAKDLEFRHTQQAALISHRDNLIANLAELIAKYRKSIDERSLLATGHYDFESTDAKGKTMLDTTERVTVVHQSNEEDEAWTSQREAQGYLIKAYFGTEPKVLQSWALARAALDTADECATSAYEQYHAKGHKGVDTSHCVPLAQGADSAVALLWTSISAVSETK